MEAPEGLSIRGPSAGIEGSPPGEAPLLAWHRGSQWVGSVSGVVRAQLPGWGGGGQRVGAVVDLVLEGLQVMLKVKSLLGLLPGRRGTGRVCAVVLWASFGGGFHAWELPRSSVTISEALTTRESLSSTHSQRC